MSIWLKNSEPVILTLSSDEDEKDDSPTTNKSSLSFQENIDGHTNQHGFSEPINPKEPIIKPKSKYENYQRHYNNMPDNDYGKQMKLQTHNDWSLSALIQCRYLRIGSYKVIPKKELKISFKGIEIQVPPFAEGEKKTTITILLEMKGIVKVLAHLGHTLPVLFVYTTDPMAADIRSHLKMTDKNGFYYDPCSQEESQKRITILLEKENTDLINFVKNILNIDLFDSQNGERIKLFEELTQKDANEIFVKSSPGEVDSFVQGAKTSNIFETKTLLVFPPSPNKGGISITMDDYLCLKDEQFLNDVLIDFYLKWLHMCHLSDRDRERTHLFSTFFYKRLTAKPKTSHRPHATEDHPGLTPSKRRHVRVKSWTKNVDIFTKDFILIPINEHAHWFLTVICFPYLDGPVQVKDGKPVPRSEATVPLRSSTRHKKAEVKIPVIDDGDWSDRDEAEGDENELDFFYEEDPFEDDLHQHQPPRKKPRDHLEPLKQPCILIFDSLSGEPRSRIVATLRDYLAEEHLLRRGSPKTFSKETMQGACPKVPQQMNFSDCGLFTLQFAQSFFERPLQDFRLPIQSLSNWFDQDVVSNKRVAIADLISSLMDKYKPNHDITLPSIHSTFRSADSEERRGSPPPSQDAELRQSTEEVPGKRKSTKEAQLTAADPKATRGDDITLPGVASSLKYLNSLSDNQNSLSGGARRSQNGASKNLLRGTKLSLSSSSSRKKEVDSLQLLQDSYGDSNAESDDDEIFMVNKSSGFAAEKNSQTIGLGSLSRCKR